MRPIVLALSLASAANSFPARAEVVAVGVPHAATARAPASAGTSADTRAPVPEPSTWALWLAGTGLAGHLVRRRRAAPTFASSLLGAATLALAGCAAASMAPPPPAATVRNCDSNADYGMTGVLHASTKRELDNCRRGL